MIDDENKNANINVADLKRLCYKAKEWWWFLLLRLIGLGCFVFGTCTALCLHIYIIQ